MNARQRKRKLERARAHQVKTRNTPSHHGFAGGIATAPPKPRRRTLSKRIVRAMGRKLRPRP